MSIGDLIKTVPPIYLDDFKNANIPSQCLQEFLLKPINKCILLILGDTLQGHYVTLIKHDKDTLYYFDPQGGSPLDIYKKYESVRNNKHQPLSEYYKYLKSFKNIIYNEERKQGDNNLCGYYCLHYLICYNIKKSTPEDYINILDTVTKNTNITPDEIVLAFLSQYSNTESELDSTLDSALESDSK